MKAASWCFKNRAYTCWILLQLSPGQFPRQVPAKHYNPHRLLLNGCSVHTIAASPETHSTQKKSASFPGLTTLNNHITANSTRYHLGDNPLTTSHWLLHLIILKRSSCASPPNPQTHINSWPIADPKRIAWEESNVWGFWGGIGTDI